VNSLVEQRSWTYSGSASLNHRWTPRRQTTAGYSYSRNDFVGGGGFDTVMHGARADYTHSLTRTAGLRANYGFSQTEMIDAGGNVRPVDNHTIEGGFTYDRRVSPTRQISFAASGGATYVSTIVGFTAIDRQYWMPSGSASARVDLGRAWALYGDYRRSLTVLDGISFEAFFTDAASARLGGLIGSRLELVLSAAYANGQAGEGVNEVGHYRSVTSGAQVRYAINRTLAALVNYQHYEYRLSDVTTVGGFPPQLDRNALRFGLTVWLPLYGAWSQPGRVEGGR
jgi:hypothetical protein